MAYLKIKYRPSDGYSAGKYHDVDAIRDVINYIFDPAKTPSGYIGGVAVDPQNAIHQMTTLSVLYAQSKGVALRHMILAFEPKELGSRKRDTLYFANALAFQIAHFYGGSYQIVYAVHENTPKPHVHFVMNTTNYRTGQKYSGSRSDFYRFIAYINELLAPFGTHVVFLSDDGWEPGSEQF